MKKKLLLVLVLILSLPPGRVIFAQGNTSPLSIPAPDTAGGPADLNNPLSESTSSNQTTLPNQQPVLTSQKLISSNLSCIKVGDAPEDQKASVCKEIAIPLQQGTIGPVFGSGRPTVEYCGEDLNGQPIMCYKPSYVFYCQGDPQWGNICNMSQAGCGPTTMAMLFSAFGDIINPLEMDRDIFQKRGWRACGDNPSSMQSAIQTLLPEKGYEYHALGAPLNLTRAQEYLNAGYLIIGSTFGHIFIIDGVDVTNQTLRLRDPGRCENKDGIVRAAGAPWGGQPLIYSYAVKKVVK